MNIVIVSHYFSPYNGVGAKRMSYLARYLFNQGENITVFKASNRHYPEPLFSDFSEDSAIKFVEIDINLKIAPGFMWYASYKAALTAYLKKNKVDVVIFSGGPFYYFPLGKYIQKKFGTRYILDYRDAWTFKITSFNENSYCLKVISQIKNTIYLWQEKQVVKSAKLVVSVTNRMNDEMIAKYGLSDTKKFKCFMNGYDEAVTVLKQSDLDTRSVINSVFTVVISGKFAYYSREHVRIVFSTLRKLVDEGLNIEILQIGLPEKDMRVYAKKYNLEDKYNCTGVMDYEQALQLIQQTNICLLNSKFNYALGTKIFDYIYANKPIIALISTNSAIADVLQNFENGFVCDSEEDLKSIILRIVTENLDELGSCSNKLKYSRQYQMSKYYDAIRTTID